MAQLSRRIEVPLVVFMFLFGAAFLLKMCYLSLLFNTVFGILFLTALYVFLHHRHNLDMPMVLIVLLFIALQVDALGNFYGMYGRRFGPMQYDEFSHLGVQLLATPAIVWLLQQFLDKRHTNLSIGTTSVLAGAIMFSLSAFYEIIELWDELYVRGKRIWGPYDTATDLQWDLCGILIGTILANLILALISPRRSAVTVSVSRTNERSEQPLAGTVGETPAVTAKI